MLNKKDAVISQNATFGTIFSSAKKGIGPVVATALLLVVAVVSVVGFQGWFQTFSSNLFVDIEQRGSISHLDLGIETLVGSNLYIKAGSGLNITSVSIDGNDCGVSGIYYNMSSIDVSDCLESVSTSTPEIVLVTDKGVSSKIVFISGSSNNLGPIIIESDGNFNLLENGIITCNGASVGETGELGGITYTAVSNQNLSEMIGSNNINFYETACTSLVTTMNLGGSWNTGVFYNSNINPDISHWDVSNVQDMNGMFRNTNSFNQSLGSWDVSSVTNMGNMFQAASSFNQPLDNWDVSNVEDMNGMFYGAINFNQSLDNWDVSSVTSMQSMFQGASSFNQPLDNWDVSNIVSNLANMFRDANSFNQNISSWCTKFLEEPSAFSLNSPLDELNKPEWGRLCEKEITYIDDSVNFYLDGSTIKCENAILNSFGNVEGNIYFAVDNNNIHIISNVGLNFTYSGSNIIINSSNICTSKVDDMEFIFNGNLIFNENINYWDVSNVINMRGMFLGANNFNQSLNNWNVTSVINMDWMFFDATNFNQDLSSWCVTNILSEPGLFALNSPLNTNGLKPSWGSPCP